MAVKSIFIAFIIWPLMLGLSLSVPKSIHKAAQKEKSDVKGVDEVQIKYPNIELDSLCKGTENPKCESIIDGFCDKTCIPNLCAKHGSIRSMCRMVCETEDLVPECSKMGPSNVVKKSPQRRKYMPVYQPSPVNPPRSVSSSNPPYQPLFNEMADPSLNQGGQYYPDLLHNFSYPSYPMQDAMLPIQ